MQAVGLAPREVSRRFELQLPTHTTVYVRLDTWRLKLILSNKRRLALSTPSQEPLNSAPAFWYCTFCIFSAEFVILRLPHAQVKQSTPHEVILKRMHDLGWMV